MIFYYRINIIISITKKNTLKFNKFTIIKYFIIIKFKYINNFIPLN